MGQGDSRQALPYLRQALDVANESNLRRMPRRERICGGGRGLSDWDEATRFNDEAKRLKIASRAGNLVYTAECRADRAGTRPARRGDACSRRRWHCPVPSVVVPAGLAVASPPPAGARAFEALM
jgi:hypothetical protein